MKIRKLIRLWAVACTNGTTHFHASDSKREVMGDWYELRHESYSCGPHRLVKLVERKARRNR